MKYVFLLSLLLVISCSSKTTTVNKIQFDISTKENKYFLDQTEVKVIDNRVALRENSAISIEVLGLSKLKFYDPKKHEVIINSKLTTYFSTVPKIQNIEINSIVDSTMSFERFQMKNETDSVQTIIDKRRFRRKDSPREIANEITKEVFEFDTITKELNQNRNTIEQVRNQIGRAIKTCDEMSVENRIGCLYNVALVTLDGLKLNKDSKEELLKIEEFVKKRYFIPAYHLNHRRLEIIDYLESARDEKNYNDAIKQTDFKNDSVMVAKIKVAKQQVVQYSDLIDGLQEVLTDLVVLNNEFSSLFKYPGLYSTKISPKGADKMLIVVGVREIDSGKTKSSDTIPTNTGISIRGIKFDFSGGFFYSNLYDNEYYVTQRQAMVDKTIIDNGVEKVVKEPATFSTIHTKNQKNYSIGLMTYVHMRLKGYKSVQPGTYFGTGLWLGDDTRLVYSLGGSLSFIAFNQRCALHLGYMLGNTKSLNSSYKPDVEYQESITEPQMESKRDGGLLFGVSINFNQKIKMK